jgi:hypothetical protein
LVPRVVRLFIFLIALVPTGCSLLSHEAPAEDVDKAAALFFQRLGNQDFEKIYADVAQKFKENQPRQTITDNLKQIAEHGKVQDFERISMTFQGEGKNRIASPVYRTSTEKAKAEITLNFQDESGEWKLIGFAYKPR